MTGLEITVARHSAQLEHIQHCLEAQDARFSRIEEKLDRVYLALIGVLGSTVTASILLAVDIAVTR